MTHFGNQVLPKMLLNRQYIISTVSYQEYTFLQGLMITDGINDPIEFALKKYAVHQSVLNIKEAVSESRFSFKEVCKSDVENEINNLNPKKANTFNNIPPKILKEIVIYATIQF